MLTLLLFACEPYDAELARREWMRDVLVRENEVWRYRDPEELANKYEVMAADPYDFLRGSSGFWYADLARPETERVNTAFLTEAAATTVVLVGDPHPENFGTGLPGESWGLVQDPDAAITTLEPVDLDGAVFGPWLADVRRGALGIALLAEGTEVCDEACVESVAWDYARAYALEMEARAVGEAGWDATGSLTDEGAVIEALRAKAHKNGAKQKKLEDNTWLSSEGVRTFRTNDPELVPLSETESAQLARLLAGWGHKPTDFRKLGEVRRLGSGVASLPALRYGVLWDRGSDGPEDDELLEVREVIDPASVAGRLSTVGLLFDDNADRIRETSRRLWSRPDADALHDGLSDGAYTFKTRAWSSWFTELDHLDIAEDADEGDVEPADLARLAHILGRALASNHAHGTTADSESVALVVTADLNGRGALLADQTAATAVTDLARLHEDHALFVESLALYGELLGAEAVVVDVGS